jgi:hypothetical protein
LPHCDLNPRLPRRELNLPRRKLNAPRRKLNLPRRKLNAPRRKLNPPRRVLNPRLPLHERKPSGRTRLPRPATGPGETAGPATAHRPSRALLPVG